ncbi:hypothetical protein ACMDZ0_001153 [Enterococcus hirae]|nr:hypothetical protein [Enterococcus hirae]
MIKASLGVVKAKREDTMKRTWRTLSKTDGYQPISDEAGPSK